MRWFEPVRNNARAALTFECVHGQDMPGHVLCHELDLEFVFQIRDLNLELLLGGRELAHLMTRVLELYLRGSLLGKLTWIY